MTLMDAALQYGAAGIPVFPLHWLKTDGACSCSKGAACECKGKHPRIKNWCEEASTDQAKIHGWWSKTPSANIGIPMGEKSGLVTLDVDTRHGGDASLTALVKEHGELPKTITATTGGIDCLDKDDPNDKPGVYAFNVRNGAKLTEWDMKDIDQVWNIIEPYFIWHKH